ncbi:uncharacterized protein EDB91DRAFT_1153773 [Suillus paluster]|uniref:uncharacterized protein n=1 Tax=Suillus paluster TaxID=48578 RepID=UPI001B86A9B8|nr:uncharacterized protein EDB91DRAFT_1153773 [Suillus paluster]KAG1731634.1 hypothetical protein EDB91DRAFT_1153773 [Suillus paluster]
MTGGGFSFHIGFYYPMFFFQLDAIKDIISVAFSFYSDLVILNASKTVGRVTSGFIAPFIGVPLLTIPATISCGMLNLGMIGLSTPATVVVLYGYFGGP